MHARNSTVRPSHGPDAGLPTNSAASPVTPTPEEPRAVATFDDESGNESDESSSGSSSSSSSSSSSDDELSESEVDEQRLTLRQRKKRTLRPFVGSIFEGKLASFIICDECKNGERHGHG